MIRVPDEPSLGYAQLGRAHAAQALAITRLPLYAAYDPRPPDNSGSLSDNPMKGSS